MTFWKKKVFRFNEVSDELTLSASDIKDTPRSPILLFKEKWNEEGNIVNENNTDRFNDLSVELILRADDIRDTPEIPIPLLTNEKWENKKRKTNMQVQWSDFHVSVIW